MRHAFPWSFAVAVAVAPVTGAAQAPPRIAFGDTVELASRGMLPGDLVRIPFTAEERAELTPVIGDVVAEARDLMEGMRLATPKQTRLDGPDAEVVREREIAFARTMADRDFAAFQTFIDPDAVFFDGDRPIRGREAVAEAWRDYFEGPEAPFSWTPDLVQVLESGGLALSSGPVTAGGREVGRFNSVWRRGDDGVWRVVFDKGS